MPDEIDALVQDEDEHDVAIARLERVDSFRVEGSWAWVGPED